MARSSRLDPALQATRSRRTGLERKIRYRQSVFACWRPLTLSFLERERKLIFGRYQTFFRTHGESAQRRGELTQPLSNQEVTALKSCQLRCCRGHSAVRFLAGSTWICPARAGDRESRARSHAHWLCGRGQQISGLPLSAAHFGEIYKQQVFESLARSWSNPWRGAGRISKRTSKSAIFSAPPRPVCPCHAHLSNGWPLWQLAWALAA